MDGGQRWAQYKGSDFPAVAVRDIVVHPRASDLVLATHGRGIWIIDDISPLRALTPDLMAKNATFIAGRPGRSVPQSQRQDGRKATEFHRAQPADRRLHRLITRKAVISSAT